MRIRPMYKDRWAELFICTLVVIIISLMVNIQDPSGLLIITSLASTSLALMVAPGAPTNSIRSVFLSYLIAMFVAITFALLFTTFVEKLITNPILLFFLEFYLMLLVTLLLFGVFNAYHPPAIGAMLAYFIDTRFDDLALLFFIPVSVVFILASIKSYIYTKHSDEFKWRDIGLEFSRDYRKRRKSDDLGLERIKAIEIARNLKAEKVDSIIIQKATGLSEKEVADIVAN